MTQPIQPVQTGPSDKEQAMIGLNHALLGAFHNLYLGKKRPVPPGLEHMQLQHNPTTPVINNPNIPTLDNETPGPHYQQPPVVPPTPLGMPNQSMSRIPLTAIATRLMGRRN